MSEQPQKYGAPRRKFCSCSRADSDAGFARPECPLHGSTEVAKAYRAGMADALAGYPMTAQRPAR